MIVDVECDRCGGEGWFLQRNLSLGPGLYEATCPKCEGHGAYATDADDEVEDWMEDESDFECMMMADGICLKAGSEECEWECPRNRG